MGDIWIKNSEGESVKLSSDTIRFLVLQDSDNTFSVFEADSFNYRTVIETGLTKSEAASLIKALTKLTTYVRVFDTGYLISAGETVV